MKVKQLSVFLENQSGRLADVMTTLGNEGINIRALSLADTSGFGILRLIVSDIEKAHESLKNKGLTVNETDVLAVEVPDRPGGLANILQMLAENDINIEYMYAFVEKSSENAVVIFRIEDTTRAADVFRSKGVRILTTQEAQSL